METKQNLGTRLYMLLFWLFGASWIIMLIAGSKFNLFVGYGTAVAFNVAVSTIVSWPVYFGVIAALDVHRDEKESN